MKTEKDTRASGTQVYQTGAVGDYLFFGLEPDCPASCAGRTAFGRIGVSTGSGSDRVTKPVNLDDSYWF
jgi:hypothetical protein